MIFTSLLIAGFACLHSVSCQQEPTISYISKEKVTSLGDSVNLICETAYTTDYNVQWIKKTGSGPMLLSTGSSMSLPEPRMTVRVDKGKYTLKIDKIVENDKGTYECRIQMAPTKVIKAEVNVTIRIPPVITDDSSRHIITSIGGEVILRCFATGHPEPRISFRRGKNKLLPSGRAYHIGKELKIQNITKEHQGTYYCVADNGVGGDRRAISVEVEYPPSIKVYKDRVGQAYHYNQDLVCYIEAFPSASISWSKDGELLKDNKNYNISLFPTNNEYVSTSILRVRRIEKRNFGTYVCQAANKFGVAKGFVELYETQNVVCPPDCSPLYSPLNSFNCLAPHRFIFLVALVAIVFNLQLCV